MADKSPRHATTNKPSKSAFVSARLDAAQAKSNARAVVIAPSSSGRVQRGLRARAPAGSASGQARPRRSQPYRRAAQSVPGDAFQRRMSAMTERRRCRADVVREPAARERGPVTVPVLPEVAWRRAGDRGLTLPELRSLPYWRGWGAERRETAVRAIRRRDDVSETTEIRPNRAGRAQLQVVLRYVRR